MSFDYHAHFQTAIDEIKADSRYRYFTTIGKESASFPKARLHLEDGSTRDVTVWCGNDYLGMSHNPKVIAAATLAAQKHGTSAGGTRNISGSTPLHSALETSVADLHGKQAGLVFTSGYVTNSGTLATLGRLMPDCVIFSDRLNHASMIHGIKNSKATCQIFHHNDMNHLEELLQAVDIDRPKLIAFESVYSMEGDIANIKGIIALAKKYNAMTYLDEVHAVGMYGARGGGMAEMLGVMDDIDILQGTFGKAYGAMGGFITGDAVVIDAVRSFCSEFIFTTSQTPATLAACLTAVEHLKTSHEERRALHENAKLLKAELQKAGLGFHDGKTHIVPLIVGDATCCREIASALLEGYDIYVQPINFPTVPVGTERLRLAPSALHTRDDITHLVSALKELWEINHVPQYQQVG